MKYIKLILLTILVCVILGLVVTRMNTRYLTYIRSIGIGATRVYTDISDIPVSREAVTWMYHGLSSGAPGPVVLGGALLTRKIVMHQVEYDKAAQCGIFTVTLYTLFNVPLYTNMRIVVPCA